MPPTWTYECDEDLIHFLYDHLGKEDENLGSVKQYVESIDVSSYTVGSGTPPTPSKMSLLARSRTLTFKARAKPEFPQARLSPAPHFGSPVGIPRPFHPYQLCF